MLNCEIQLVEERLFEIRPQSDILTYILYLSAKLRSDAASNFLQFGFSAEVNDDFDVRVWLATFEHALESKLHLFDLQLNYGSIWLFMTQVLQGFVNNRTLILVEVVHAVSRFIFWVLDDLRADAAKAGVPAADGCPRSLVQNYVVLVVDQPLLGTAVRCLNLFCPLSTWHQLLLAHAVGQPLLPEIHSH